MAVAGPTMNHTEIRHWADSQSVLPVEVLPQILDSEPAVLRLMRASQIAGHAEIKQISWEEFFMKFDALGLTLVYDTDPTGMNEILQVEENSPYRNPSDRTPSTQN